MDDSSRVSQCYAAVDAMEDREWMREFHGYVIGFDASVVYRSLFFLIVYTQRNVPDQSVCNSW